ncbi:MAG: 2-polyprenyl-3-methyl-6-methoxy-1,4-benzoquinone monooxygenase [Pseudomonadales bacterium]|nr:2-polyprenyl-3-methyl-6-methoxy-1,4-benzoquinone monooxygenase [Pseudomonadales bacterium]
MTYFDTFLTTIDRGLRSVTGVVKADRPNPAADNESALTDDERRHAAGLMRVNHCGEICAQALYEGQALTARHAETRESLAAAARQEEDHLAWCRERLTELDGRPSVLDPAFYVASLALGAVTGLLGDRVSLGFIEATEDQVKHHLDRHIEKLPEGDERSRAILSEMRADEVRHGEDAVRSGGVVFPEAIKGAMGLVSKVMTETTYRI